MDRFAEAADKVLKSMTNGLPTLSPEEIAQQMGELCTQRSNRPKEYEEAMALFFAELPTMLSGSGGLQATKSAPENFSFVARTMIAMHLAAESMEEIMASIKPNDN